MKLQRYPDGGASWTLFIWGRHPANSLTWTHSLTLTRYRKESGFGRKLRMFWQPDQYQRQYGIVGFRLCLTLARQNAMPRDRSDAVDAAMKKDAHHG